MGQPARDPDKARKFALAEGASRGMEIEVSGTVEAALRGADIVCTLTKAREPILKGARQAISRCTSPWESPHRISPPHTTCSSERPQREWVRSSTGRNKIT